MTKQRKSYRRGCDHTRQIMAICPVCGKNHVVKLNSNQVESHITQRIYCTSCDWRRTIPEESPDAAFTYTNGSTTRPISSR